MSPTARSLNLLRQLGFIAAPVERYIHQIQQSRDLWHFGDIIAAHPRDREILIVQSTSLPNLPARKKKSLQQPELAAWLAAGGKFELHGWVQKDGRWSALRLAITDSLTPFTVQRPRRKKRRPSMAMPELF